MTQAIINSEEELSFSESGKTLKFKMKAGDSVETTMNRLEKAIIASGMNIELVRNSGSASNPNKPQILKFQHNEFGSDHSFNVASNTAGLLSVTENVSDEIKNGIDVAGFIGGELGV